MIKNKFLADVSISTAQVVLNQLTGIVVFFIITAYLDKNNLGQINWAMALLTVMISVLGFGLEHIAVRKAATGEDPGLLLQSYLAHTIIFSLGLLLVVWFAQSQLAWLQDGNIFFWLTLAQCISFIAVPFRHIANGLEKFQAFFMMSSGGNMVKLLLLLLFAVWNEVSLSTVVRIYLFASLAELLICVLLYRFKLGLPVPVGFGWKGYLSFVREALPQLGVTVFNTAMARMDWVLLGLLSSTAMVADYSVTNKLFELATIPLLVIAPVIFPKISKMFSTAPATATGRVDYLSMLMKLEIMVAVYIAMAVNICWKDVIDPLTGNKYGAATMNIIFIMSFAMPLLYINNIFWSILFAKQQMKKLLLVFCFGFLVNLLADIVLIPICQAKGAALGYLVALLTQTILYACWVPLPALRKTALQLLPTVLMALCAGVVSNLLFGFFIWKLLTATIIFLLLMVSVGQLRMTDWREAKKILAT